MSFVNKYRSTTIYGELKVQKYNTGGVTGLLDISGNTILRGDVGIYGNLYASDGTVDISGNLTVTGDISGNFTGSIANATNAVNTGITGNITNASFYPSFVSGITGYLPHYVDTDFNYNPSTNTLTCTNITGTCSNATNATNSTNVAISTDGTNATFYPTFVSTTTGNLPAKVDSDLNYNPSTNTLTCTNITGTCSKIRVIDTETTTNDNFCIPYSQVPSDTFSATDSLLAIDASFNFNPFTNTLNVPNISGTCSDATNSTNVAISTDGTNATFYPTFVSTTTGNLPAKVDSDLNYNPSTNTLTCTNITGTCSNATNATNSTNVAIAIDATNASFYPTFVSTTTGNLPLKVDGGITYNPSTNILTTTVSKVVLTTDNTSNIQFPIPYASANPTVGGTSVTLYGSTSNLFFNPSTSSLICANFTGTADSANGILISNSTTNTNYRIALGSAVGGAVLYSNNGLLYNPSTQVLLTPCVGGVWLIDGTNTGSLNALIPLFTSQTNLGDINNQSALNFDKQDTTLGAAGSYVNPFDNTDKIDRIIVFPRWGIVGYQDSGYAGTLNINYKNNYDFPVYVDLTDNVMTSCRIYWNGTQQ